MPLTLKIVSKQRHILGSDSLRVFSVHGGSIGRAPDNDWVLPDPDRYISGHHAAIDYRDGAYYLQDNSTNGVFVNHSEQPVGRGTPIRLYDGDELRMGDYLFSVTVVNISRDGADDSGDAQGTGTPSNARADAAGWQETAPEASLKLLGDAADQLEDAARNGHSEPGAEDNFAFATTVHMSEEFIAQQTDLEGALSAAATDRRVDDLRLAESARIKVDSELRLDESTVVDPEANRRGNSPVFASPGQHDLTEALRLLMECIGLDSTQLSRDQDEEEVFAVLAQMIRTTVDGLQAVLRNRAHIKAQFRLSPTTFQPAGNNPLKFLDTSQEVLEQLFYEHAEGYLGPVETLQDALDDVQAHETAVIKAMQAAFRALLDRLEPDQLEERFERTTKPGGMLSSPPKAKYWDLYREAYRGLAGFSDEKVATLVGGQFADAYDREMHELATRRAAEKQKAARKKAPPDETSGD